MTRVILKVEFADTKTGRMVATGRDAETLVLLVRRAAKGVTAFDFPGGPAFRLAAYVHNLRNVGLSIETKRESHKGGTHARYVLVSTVSILSARPACKAA